MDKANKEFMDNITAKVGKSYQEIEKIYLDSHLTKHSEIRDLFKDQLGISYGYANTLTHIMSKTDGASQAEGKELSVLLNEIYSGKKEQFRPIHELVMARVATFGPFDIAPKKGYLSLRCKKQFAMIGPKTNTRMEIGINLVDDQWVVWI